MGCTLIGAAFGPEGLDWISVGDSPLYLVRKGKIVRLNEDHSLAPEIDRMAEMGRMSEEQAKAHPRRHVLRSALIGAEIDLIDWSKAPVALEVGEWWSWRAMASTRCPKPRSRAWQPRRRPPMPLPRPC